jgi:hypothetical protein
MATLVKVGTYTGSGAAQNISIGFIPDHVRITNITAPTVDEWYSGMTAGTSVTTSGTAAIRAAPNGITAFAGTPSVAGQGFTVGAGLSTNASVYRYVAVQNGPGAA